MYRGLFVSHRWSVRIQPIACPIDSVHQNKIFTSQKFDGWAELIINCNLVSCYRCSLQFWKWESKCLMKMQVPFSCDSWKEVWIHSPQALPIIWLLLAEKAGITAVICYFTWNKGRFKSHHEKLPTVTYALLLLNKNITYISSLFLMILTATSWFALAMSLARTTLLKTPWPV